MLPLEAYLVWFSHFSLASVRTVAFFYRKWNLMTFSPNVKTLVEAGCIFLAFGTSTWKIRGILKLLTPSPTRSNFISIWTIPTVKSVLIVRLCRDIEGNVSGNWNHDERLLFTDSFHCFWFHISILWPTIGEFSLPQHPNPWFCISIDSGFYQNFC